MIQAEQGYLIPAINTPETDYLACAQQLAHSLRRWHPGAKIAVMTNQLCQDTVFDYVLNLPHGDLGGYANDWQAYHVSPFRETIKLEADMLMCSPCDHWWTLMRNRDVVISHGCRDFYDQPAGSRFYRRIFDDNFLPDVYSAITYWRVSRTAREFFQWVRDIFSDWKSFRTLLKFSDDIASTDVVYAMAAKIVGEEKCIMPWCSYPSIVHMRPHIVPITNLDWSKELLWENDPPRINTIAQWGALHYHIKTWRI